MNSAITLLYSAQNGAGMPNVKIHFKLQSVNNAITHLYFTNIYGRMAKIKLVSTCKSAGSQNVKAYTPLMLCITHCVKSHLHSKGTNMQNVNSHSVPFISF